MEWLKILGIFPVTVLKALFLSRREQIVAVLYLHYATMQSSRRPFSFQYLS